MPASTTRARRPHAPAPSRRRTTAATRATKTLLNRVGRWLWPVEVEGREHLPADGPAIIAANHVSFFDSVVLLMAVPRDLTFVGKSDYLDRWTTRRLLPALGMIPIDRASGFRALEALEVASGVLRTDGLFAMYPEGTRSPDGKLHPGRTGVGHLAAATGAPIIPAGIVGTESVQPPGAKLPRPFRGVKVRFGSPIDGTGYQGTQRERRRRITRDVMDAIGTLSGQERAA